MTRAVTEALLERLQRLQKPESLAEQLLTVGQDCARHLKEPYRSINHGDALYNAQGLPE